MTPQGNTNNTPKSYGSRYKDSVIVAQRLSNYTAKTQ